MFLFVSGCFLSVFFVDFAPYCLFLFVLLCLAIEFLGML